MEPEVYEVRLAASAHRALARLPGGDAEAVLEAVSALQVEPYRQGKPLRWEYEGYRVRRRGAYRVTYRVDDEARVVHVVRLAHRRDAYRRS